MKKYFKNILMVMTCMVVLSPHSQAACYGEEMQYICSGYTTDGDILVFLQKLLNTASYISEKVQKVLLSVAQLGYKNSSVSDEDASEAEVPNINLPPALVPNSNAITVTLQGAGMVPAAELDHPSVGMGMTQDRLAQLVVVTNYIKADSTPAASYRLVKNREAFFVSGIFQALSQGYDATRKIQDMSDMMTKILEDAKKDIDYNSNLRVRHSVNTLRLMVSLHLARLDGAQAQLDLRRQIYLSPNFTSDAQSAASLGQGDTTSRSQ